MPSKSESESKLKSKLHLPLPFKRFPLPKKKNHNWFTTPYYASIESRPWLTTPLSSNEPQVGDSYSNTAERGRYTKAIDLFYPSLYPSLHPSLTHPETHAQRHERGVIKEDFDNGWGLPTEILERIGGYLGTVDLVCWRNVNRRMRYEVIACGEGGALDGETLRVVDDGFMYRDRVMGSVKLGRRGACEHFSGGRGRDKRGRLMVRVGDLSPCMWLILWQRLERDIGVDKARALSCWHCMKQHPREDFEWDSRLHGYGKDMIKSEDRICWTGYQELVRRIDSDKLARTHSRYDVSIIEVTGLGRVAAIEVDGKVGHESADLYDSVLEVCSTCCGRHSCKSCHDAPDPDICHSCYKMRRIPIVAIKGMAMLRARLTIPRYYCSLSPIFSVPTGTWILERKGKWWAVKQAWNEIRNEARKLPRPIPRPFYTLGWWHRVGDSYRYPTWWKLSFKKDLDNSS